MAKVAGWLTDFFIRYGVLSETDRGLYAYCFEGVLIFTSNFLAILLIACITGRFVPTTFYLIGFWPLRMLAGGYHAKTPGRCFAMTLLFFLSFLLSLNLDMLVQRVIIMIFLPLSVLVVFLLAPIDCPNKRFQDGQKKLLRRKCRIVSVALSCLTLFILHFSITFSYAVSCGMAVTAISLMLAIGQNSRERRDNRCSQN